MADSVAPRHDLVRQVAFEARAGEENDGLTLEGYAAVFNTPTTIDSWEGRFTEVIAPGAFRKTIQERTPVLQFDHGKHPLVGSIPIGVIRSLREDDHGLAVKARLSDNWLVQPVRDAIADGSITGMSFRFSVVKESWTKPLSKGELPTRTIHELSCVECGPVVYPAYAATAVGVRTREAWNLLADPDVRAELARLLISDTPEFSAAEGTETGEPSRDDEPAPATRAEHTEDPPVQSSPEPAPAVPVDTSYAARQQRARQIDARWRGRQ